VKPTCIVLAALEGKYYLILCSAVINKIPFFARFGKHGIAINLVDSESSMRICNDIEKHFGKKIMLLDAENSDEIEKIGS
jgi:ATP-dependent RNA helicase DDX19/DBP5